MTNPRTLLLSIIATACGFIRTLVSVGGPPPTAPASAVGDATAPGLFFAVAQDVRNCDTLPFVVAVELAASGTAGLRDAVISDSGPHSLQGRARQICLRA